MKNQAKGRSNESKEWIKNEENHNAREIIKLNTHEEANYRRIYKSIQ